MTTSTTTKGAATALRCSERTIRRLIKSGVLETVGEGHGRLITRESIERHIDERNLDIEADNPLNVSACPPQTFTMEKLLRSLAPLTLPDAAARKLGVPADEFGTLMQNGSIPAIVIGQRRYVPRRWLAGMLMQADGLQPAGGKR
jgi:excisionase family DNA binding protein